jgi:hypothetical protein
VTLQSKGTWPKPSPFFVFTFFVFKIVLFIKSQESCQSKPTDLSHQGSRFGRQNPRGELSNGWQNRHGLMTTPTEPIDSIAANVAKKQGVAARAVIHNWLQ